MRDFEWEGKRRRYRKKVILLDKAKEQYNIKITNKNNQNHGQSEKV